MPLDHAVWSLGKKGEAPKAAPVARLADEALLEDAIEREPSILNDGWMIIGRQVTTDFSGRIDLLALDADGAVIVIELKRAQTPRDVVAQVLDYGAWLSKLAPERLSQIYDDYARKRPALPKTLDAAFRARFGGPLPEEDESEHQLVVVASALDESTERIVNYLGDSDLPINVVFFQVFEVGGQTLLSRVWLRDPGETQASAARISAKEPWNGEYYVSFGHYEGGRQWADARRYGFISAGGGQWYSRTLRMLAPGARVWVNVPQTGYVGVGIVEEPMVRVRDFRVRLENGREVPLAKAELAGPGILRDADDDAKTEYAVRVRWLHTVPLEEAVRERGFFGNQNSVCKPRTAPWAFTVERLRERFGVGPKAAEKSQ